MIERLLHARIPITVVLATLSAEGRENEKAPQNLSEEQWNTLQQLQTVFRPPPTDHRVSTNARSPNNRCDLPDNARVVGTSS